MKKIYKILISLLVAVSVLSVTLLAGCTSITSTISVTATDSQTDAGTGSTESSGTTSADGTADGTSSSDASSDGGTSSGSTSGGGSTSDGSELSSSGLKASYNSADTSNATYSVAENLLSVVTIYASSTITTTTTSSSHSGMFPGYGGGTTTYTTYDREVYTGSGVIYDITDEYVYVVTCYHVVYCETLESVANESIYLYLYGSEYDVAQTTTEDTYGYIYDYGDTYIECDFVGGSWSEDVAVLRADLDDVLAINENVREVTFSQDYSVGDTATAIGNYGGEGIMVSQGIVAVESEDIDLTLGSTTNSFRVMRLDINIYSGNSGGGLFDENGYYIGMVNAMSTQYTNYAFAIPATVVCYSIENIIHYSENGIYAATIGIEVEAASSKYVYDSTTGTGAIEEVVTVTSVTSGSSAEEMGLATGDIITAVTIDGTQYSVTRTFDLEDLSLIIFSGSEVSIMYTRGGTSAQSSSYTFTADDIA